MKLKFLLIVVVCLLYIYDVQAAVWPSEGSVVLKAGEKRVLHGLVCIYSENPVPVTYNIFLPGLERFVDFIEPQGFTVDRVPCGGGNEGRKCVAKLCNDPNSTDTRMISVYFSGPTEFAFDFCNGLPCFSKSFLNPTQHTHQGSIRVTGQVGAAVTVEVVGFIVHYYPYNGWWIVVGVVVSILIVSFFLLYKKRTSGPRTIIFCPKCKKIYKKETKFCPTCGTPLIKRRH